MKRWAVPLCPKKGNNRSLLEECTLAHINAIQEPLLKPCLLDKVQANPDVVAALKEKGFTSAEQALTGRTARVQGKSIQTTDVALFSDGVNTFVGEIRWFALVESDFVVGVSTWPVRHVPKSSCSRECAHRPRVLDHAGHDLYTDSSWKGGDSDHAYSLDGCTSPV